MLTWFNESGQSGIPTSPSAVNEASSVISDTSGRREPTPALAVDAHWHVSSGHGSIAGGRITAIDRLSAGIRSSVYAYNSKLPPTLKFRPCRVRLPLSSVLAPTYPPRVEAWKHIQL